MWIAVLFLAVILAAAGFSKSDRHYIFSRNNATCSVCGRKWDDGYMLECDHIVPLGMGGSNTVDNGQLLCRNCHYEKHLTASINANSVRERNVNAQAARLQKEQIKEKGIMRYGY